LVNFSLFSFSAYDGYYKKNPSHLVAKRMLTKHLAKNCALEITSIRTREDYEQHLIITKSGGNTKKQKEKKQKEALKQMKVFDNFKIQGWKKIKTGVSTLMK